MGPLDAAIALALLALIAGSAFCSAAETSLFSLSHADRQLLASRHPATARAIERLLANPSGLLVTILLMNTAVNTSAFVLATVAGARFSAGVQGAIGIATLLLTILAGEVTPKTLAVANRLRFAPVIAPIIIFAGRILAPLRYVAEGFIIRPLARVVAPTRPPVSDAAALEELKQLLESQSASGVIQPQERRLLADVLRLRTLRVSDVMTPRRDIIWLNVSDSADDLLSACRAHGHSRYPLLAADGRSIVGVVRAQDVLPAVGATKAPASVPLSPAARAAPFVPERSRLDQLLESFRSARAELAMCVDEHGNVTGMVQIEDVVRELGVGPADSDAPERQIRMVGLNTWELPGRLSLRHLDDFLSHLGLALEPSERLDVDTVAGLVGGRLGRIPRVADVAEFASFRLVVHTVSGRSVQRVWLNLLAPTSEAEGPAPRSAPRGDASPDAGGAL